MGETLLLARAKALGELTNVATDANNPHFNARYATLGAIVDAARPVLAKHGLAVRHGVRTVLGAEWPGIAVWVIWEHVGTEEAHSEHELYVPCDLSNVQRIGSALTYARRYTLSASLGIATEDDDDGNASAPAPSSGPPRRETSETGSPPRASTGALSQAEAARVLKAASQRSEALGKEGTEIHGHHIIASILRSRRVPTFGALKAPEVNEHLRRHVRKSSLTRLLAAVEAYVPGQDDSQEPESPKAPF